MKSLFLHCVLTIASVFAAEPRAALERIMLSPDGKGFVLEKSRQPFRPWGVNYDHDEHGGGGRLLEDYWHDEWGLVAEDFGEIKALGANVVRIHLQVGRFMDAPGQPNKKALELLQRLVRLARSRIDR